jgi:hypothetical protein
MRATTKNWNKCFIVTKLLYRGGATLLPSCFVCLYSLSFTICVPSNSQSYLISDGIEEAWFAFNSCHNKRK